VTGTVLVRKLALPGIGHTAATGRELVAPGIIGAIEPAARGEFPFSLRRQFLSRPTGIGFGVTISDVDDGMIVKPADRAGWPIRMSPAGPEAKGPPLTPIPQVDGPLGRAEDE
jgi:hypothetical protein